jgi:hypothetical protein
VAGNTLVRVATKLSKLGAPYHTLIITRVTSYKESSFRHSSECHRAKYFQVHSGFGYLDGKYTPPLFRFPGEFFRHRGLIDEIPIPKLL